MIDPETVKNIRKQQVEGGVRVYFDTDTIEGASVRLDNDPKKDRSFQRIIRPLADAVSEIKTMDEVDAERSTRAQQVLQRRENAKKELLAQIEAKREEKLSRLIDAGFKNDQAAAIISILTD